MKYSRLPIDRDKNPQPVRTWRPWPLRTPFLIFFAGLCISLCVGIELVIWGCAENGCHIFGKMSTTDLSRRTNVAYNLAPTAISLCLGLLWAVVHHDIMRLEPYFQMSAEGGAAAQDSLFLDYPYTFPPAVPLIAGIRRHYVVLLSSCAYLLISFFVTPLFSGMFDDTFLERSVPGNAARNVPYQMDGGLYTTLDFMYTAYAYRWLGGSLPAFTTPTYAVLPVVDAENINTGNETWSAETVLFEAELTCEMATPIDLSVTKVDTSPKPGGPYTWSVNGHINSSSVGGPSFEFCDYFSYGVSCNNELTFLTPWTGIMADRSQLDSLSSNVTGSYMIAWAQGADLAGAPTSETAPVLRNITALFCNTSFFSQPVVAVFRGSSGKIIDIKRTGERKVFLETSGFEGGISVNDESVQVSPLYKDSAGNPVGLGFTSPEPPNTDSAMRKRFGPCLENLKLYFKDPTHFKVKSSVFVMDEDRVTAFALHNQTLDTLSGLLHADTLVEAYQSALQLLFAFWVTVEMVDDDSTEPITIMRDVWTRGFAVNKAWARVSQCGLAVVAIMVGVLCVLIGRRCCELDGEPNSLAECLRLLSGSPELSAALENAEFNEPEALSQISDDDGKRYVLELVPGRGPMILITGPAECTTSTTFTEEKKYLIDRSRYIRPDSTDRGNPQPREEKLWQLGAAAGVMFVMSFLTVLVLLVAAFTYSLGHNGLPTFVPTNSFGYKVIFSYLPLAISMSMEPVLVILGSGQCMLDPYKALNYGAAPCSRSLGIDYDKSPPHCQLVRAIVRGNVPLAMLAAAILLSNVLAVSFSGLFSPAYREFTMKTQVLTSGGLKINGTFLEPANEMYYILSAHLADGTPTLSWTTPDYYILPFYPEERNLSSYEGPTLGIGAELKCGLVKAGPTLGHIEDYPQAAQALPIPYEPFFFINVEDPCWGSDDPEFPLGDNLTWSFEEGHPSRDGFFHSRNCSDTFFALWAQQVVNPHPKNDSELYEKMVDTIALRCTTRNKIVRLTATITQGSQVNTTSNVVELDEKEVVSIYTDTSASTGLYTSFIGAVQAGMSQEREDSPYALKLFNNLMVHIEPSVVQNLTNLTHIPDSSHLVGAFQDTYRRLFAINLGLYAHEVLSVPEPSQKAPGSVTIRMQRVMMNRILFAISVAVLLFTLAVLVVVYWPRRPLVLAHLPTSLAGVYALLYASNAKRVCGELSGDTPRERIEKLMKLGGSYGYGHFQGEDGKGHFGVYEEIPEPVDDLRWKL